MRGFSSLINRTEAWLTYFVQNFTFLLFLSNKVRSEVQDNKFMANLIMPPALLKPFVGYPYSYGSNFLVWLTKAFHDLPDNYLSSFISKLPFANSFSDSLGTCLNSFQYWQLIPVFLPGKFHGQRSPAGYRQWANKDFDTGAQLSTSKQKTKHGKSTKICVPPSSCLLSITSPSFGLYLPPQARLTT